MAKQGLKELDFNLIGWLRAVAVMRGMIGFDTHALKIQGNVAYTIPRFRPKVSIIYHLESFDKTHRYHNKKFDVEYRRDH